MPELRHHLLCPMQCRSNGVTINKCPRIYCNEPDQEFHAIVTEDEYVDNVILTFFLNGMTSHLNVDTLSRNKFEAHDCPRLNLTHKDLTWDPSKTIYEDQENSMLDLKGGIFRLDVTARRLSMVINSLCMSTCEDDADILSDDNLSNIL